MNGPLDNRNFKVILNGVDEIKNVRKLVMGY